MNSIAPQDMIPLVYVDREGNLKLSQEAIEIARRLFEIQPGQSRPVAAGANLEAGDMACANQDGTVEPVEPTVLIFAKTYYAAEQYARSIRLAKWKYLTSAHSVIGMNKCKVVYLPGYMENQNACEIEEALNSYGVIHKFTFDCDNYLVRTPN